MRDPINDIGVRLQDAAGPWRRVGVLAGVLVACFLLLPIAVILPTSVTTSEFIDLPRHGISLRWFDQILHDPAWTGAFWLSVRLAFFAALIATVLGTAAALGLGRLRRGRAVLSGVMIAPLVLPYVVYALGLYNVLDDLAVALDATWPIAVGQAVLAFPIVFVAVAGGLAGADPTLARAAESLGAGWPTVVWRVEIPPIRPNIAIAGLFAFTFCFDEVVVALFLSSPSSATLPVQIFTSARDSISPAIAAASTMVMGIALVVAAVIGLLSTRARRSRQRAAEAMAR
jgi:putative spermidine/putrescine transport system permease protein